ncbi:hypothetical protein C7T94_08395 [Pedobacter yulinensis]|uniref:Uncharacterized protein n=1 Tax=Pedobacter yulinensis TaxID=2126353 RepID=A0A2T3HJV6_9SPHI|nr:hypothetical protein C7T94_08395 [Pedobacter yulinensis]
MNESPPATAYLKVLAKGTGENLLTNGSIKESDIVVVEKTTNTAHKNWKVVKSGVVGSSYYGTIQLMLFDTKEGQHDYLIQLSNLQRTTIQYTVTRRETGSPCKPVAFPISNIKLTDHPFSYMTEQGKELLNFLIIEL